MSIGFFDSGVGGLSIFRHAIKRLPDFDFLYVADSANCPWGEKSDEFILNRASRITEFLLGKGAKMIVVACNSASVNTIEKLREKYPDIPFVGVEPGVKPALLATKKGRVAVLATRATSRGEKFLNTKEKYGHHGKVIVIPAPELVDWVENDSISLSFCKEARLSEILDPVITADVDQIVLGCTHFPFLYDCIRKILPDSINIIDTSIAVCNRIETLAKDLPKTGETGKLKFFTSGNLEKTNKLIQALIGIENVRCEKIEK